MASHLEILNHVADTANAVTSVTTSLSSFLDAVVEFVPKAGYALTVLAAFFPKPPDDAPAILKWIHKLTHLAAWNVKHAANGDHDQTM